MSVFHNFYTDSPRWHEKIGGIHAMLERVKISEEQSGDILRLRKLNRILSIHSSTAIEGNRLTLGQVTDVINGKPVLGPPKDIQEIRNAWLAYNEIENLNPWSSADFLKAHSLMTKTLIDESGKFRTINVAVVRGDGVVLHRGAPPGKVPALVKDLFAWAKKSEAHPLIKSSAVHYMIEHIHPFRDGNGRIGRLWQTLILSKWNPLFAWMPVETLVHHNQADYYKALQDSHAGGKVEARPFVDFMLDVIKDSLSQYIDVATEPEKHEQDAIVTDRHVGINVGINVGIKDALIRRLKNAPRLTTAQLASLLKTSTRTIERHLKYLREQGVIKRAGSKKTGHWEFLK